MRLIKKRFLFPVCIIATGVVFFACSKNEETIITGTVAPTNPCAARVITVNAISSAPSSPCSNDGKVIINALGSREYTYSIDGSGFQSSNTFTNLAPGDHTYIVKDGTGCTKSASVNIAALHPGSLFIGVKVIMINKCVNCHGGSFPAKGIDLGSDCVIASVSERILAKAIYDPTDTVFNSHKSIVSLSSADSTKLRDWRATGVQYGGTSSSGMTINPSAFYQN